MYPQGAPDYGTHPKGELPVPRSPGYLVFAPFIAGVSNVVAFGPDQYEAARKYAEGLHGLVVQAPVVADYT
jgi:hypothetical protein